jgi:hypothetical protein
VKVKRVFLEKEMPADYFRRLGMANEHEICVNHEMRTLEEMIKLGDGMYDRKAFQFLNLPPIFYVRERF